MIRTITRYYKPCILTVIIVLTVLIASCAISRSGYRTITINNEICHYSIECSRYYKKVGPYIDRTPEPNWISLQLLAPTKKERAEIIQPSDGKIETVIARYIPASITIFTVVADGVPYMVDTSRERLELTLEKEENWRNFKLLERSAVVVSGVEGEMIVYLTDKLGMFNAGENTKNLEYGKVIYFDHNGLIWEMKASCDQNMSEQVKADFDHIIQTFKILN
jgi:hypothetical protein